MEHIWYTEREGGRVRGVGLLVQHCGRCGGLLWLGRPPEDHTVLARLGESHLPKPPDTVHVVTMNVTSGEEREVDQGSRETP